MDAEGLDAEGRVMDCHALAFPDESFDVTGSQFGVMLVPDQPLALREMVRVTKPGGRVLLIAYGNPDEFEALHFFIGAVQAVVGATLFNVYDRRNAVVTRYEFANGSATPNDATLMRRAVNVFVRFAF